MAPIQKDRPLLRRRGDSISKRVNGLGMNKILVVGSTGAEMKNDCAGKDQLKFSGLNWTGLD
jgi:hypothetical protein